MSEQNLKGKVKLYRPAWEPLLLSFLIVSALYLFGFSPAFVNFSLLSGEGLFVMLIALLATSLLTSSIIHSEYLPPESVSVELFETRIQVLAICNTALNAHKVAIGTYILNLVVGHVLTFYPTFIYGAGVLVVVHSLLLLTLVASLLYSLELVKIIQTFTRAV